MKLDFNITENDIPEKNCGRKSEPICGMLKDFLASKKPIAELVSDDDARDAKHRANSLYATIRRKKLPIVLAKRGERIFLIRSDKPC